MSASKWTARLADAWLPRCCGLCEQDLDADEAGLCRWCLRRLPGVGETRCPVCGLRHAGGQAACLPCRQHPPAFDATWVLADYEPPLDRLVGALKFGKQWSLGRALGAAMALAWQASSADPALAHRITARHPPLVCAVPLGEQRLRERGFNQSQVIADALRSRLGWPARHGLVRRRHETLAQSGLAQPARQDNLAGAFDCPRATARLRLAQHCVVVIDDVMTTGNTLNAVAATLKAAGAHVVVNMVAARTA